MRIQSRHGYLAAILLLAMTTVLLLAVHRSEPVQPPQPNGLAVIDGLLGSQQQTADYRLVPESMMTGLCWYADDGSKQGVFKDVNDGMSQWRYREPMDRASRDKPNRTTGRVPDGHGELVALANELDGLGFEATAYSAINGYGRLSGTLHTTRGSQQVSMNLRLPVKIALADEDSNSIELSATTAGSVSAILNLPKNGLKQPVHLCLIMQAARQSVFPESSSGKPLLLSNYY